MVFPVGITGNVAIDTNGDREADYSLTDMDRITGVMVPVASYLGTADLIEFISEIEWPGLLQKPPLDVPECGFTGDAPNCVIKGNIQRI